MHPAPFFCICINIMHEWFHNVFKFVHQRRRQCELARCLAAWRIGILFELLVVVCTVLDFIVVLCQCTNESRTCFQLKWLFRLGLTFVLACAEWSLCQRAFSFARFSQPTRAFLTHWFFQLGFRLASYWLIDVFVDGEHPKDSQHFLRWQQMQNAHQFQNQ